jgi:uncharacterized membrane protein
MWLQIFRVLAAAAFAAIGMLHFTHTEQFVSIMPPFIPESLHRAAVLVSGVAEIAGGVGLLIPPLRRAAGWGLIALLIAVFPANIHMAVNNVGIGDVPPDPLILWLRLPFQLVFAAWVWWVADLPRPWAQRR